MMIYHLVFDVDKTDNIYFTVGLTVWRFLLIPLMF